VFLGLLHHVDADNVAEVLDVRAASVFRIEIHVCRFVSLRVCVYCIAFCFEKQPEKVGD
jgi:hypothetical protein